MSQFIPSAQVQANGQPRFRIPAHPGVAAWDAAAAEEASGGVEADIRIFLDAQCGEGDVVVDLHPGFGFVALSAATVTNGMPAVLVYGLPDGAVQPLQDAAADAGAWFDAFPAERREQMPQDVAERVADDGRVFVHCRAADVAGVCAALLPQREADRLLAVCIADAGGAQTWPDASRALTEIGFAPAYLAEKNGEIVLQPVRGVPDSPVIAIPSDLLA